MLVELPSDARTRVAENADALWTLDEIVLAGLYNSLNALIYGMADAKKRGNPPSLVGPSWMKDARKSTLPTRVMSASELIEILNMPRGGE